MSRRSSPKRIKVERSARNDAKVDDDLSPPRRRERVPTKRKERADSPKVIVKQEAEERQDFDDGRYAEPRKRVTLFNKSKRRGGDDEDPERKSRETMKQKELEEKYKNWAKGITQTKQREEKLKDMEETLNEGFARYADDKAMNKYLKEQLNEELDPMAEYYKAKKQKIEMKTGLVYPTYKGHYPPNRFGIAPGYRWDGVDRSNGFEGKLAQEENRRRSMQTEAYRSIIECED